MQHVKNISAGSFPPSTAVLHAETSQAVPERWKSVLRTALATDASKTLLFQRLVLAGVVLPHGLQKAFGWFGGWGLNGTVAWFQSALDVPAPVAALVIASDLLGALALAFGLFSRLTALGIALTMLGAVSLVHAPNGFFMNWGGSNPGEGYEFHLLALALSMPLAVRGGGAASLDRWLARRFE